MGDQLNYMTLKILLPFKVFDTINNVKRIVAETTNGSYGFLPQRLDCSARLKPGIFQYETTDGKNHFIALDEGIFIKTGNEVLVSVRNAIGGTDLGKLHEAVEKEFQHLDENEKNTRKVMSRLESNFIHNMEKIRNEI